MSLAADAVSCHELPSAQARDQRKGNVMSDLHSATQGFATAAATYVRGRPDYPPQVQQWLMKDLQIGPGRTVVDLGAGTGKFTKLLASTGAAVIAVEPVDAMRAQLAESLPGVTALAGTAQQMPLPNASVDCVVCAQAFHWFATREALAEIHRVLKPGAWFGLIWNVRDETEDWVARLTDIIAPYEGDAPRFHTGRWREPFDGRHFSDLELSIWPHRHEGSADAVIVDRVMCISFIAALPAAGRAQVERRVREMIATHPALRGRASVAFPYRTEAHRCRRLD
jgi:SAM-dependent methyltransferase